MVTEGKADSHISEAFGTLSPRCPVLIFPKLLLYTCGVTAWFPEVSECTSLAQRPAPVTQVLHFSMTGETA